MKINILITILIAALSISAVAENTNTFNTRSDTNSTTTISNLTGCFNGQLVNADEVLKTNGFKVLAFVAPTEHFVNTKSQLPMCQVFLYYYGGTNFITCLKMPATNLCKIILFDKEGHKVKKTKLGQMYGWPLTQEQIKLWRLNLHDRHESFWIWIVPNGMPKYDLPTAICSFGIKEAFEIKEPGEYELHVQLRLIQTGMDNLGKIHYLQTWLPEATAKVQIRPEDLK